MMTNGEAMSGQTTCDIRDREHHLCEELRDTVEALTMLISGDRECRVKALPKIGSEITLLLTAPTGKGKLMGRGGDTFQALRKVVAAASWPSGVAHRLILDESDSDYGERDRHGSDRRQER